VAKDDLREQPIIMVLKKHRGHAHHGGAWKVAFADFMTAMMAMFLVLWIVSQSTDVKSAIAGYFQDPLGRADEFGSSVIPGPGAARPPQSMPLNLNEVTDPRIDRLGRMANHISEQIKSMPELADVQSQIQMEMTEEGLKIHLLEDSNGVFFESGGAIPAPAGRALLMALGRELAILPNHLIVEGHTDSRPFPPHSRYTNWELSTERANAARRLLVDGGLRESQIDAVRGLADRELRIPDNPLAPENRRVTILMELGIDLVQSEATSSTNRSGRDSSAATGRAGR
jgi:chemotaxis protein MotB